MSNSESSLNGPGQHPYLSNHQYSAANPYTQGGHTSAFPNYPGYTGYSTMTPYASYGGVGNPYSYGFNSLPSEQLWQGFLGQTAESLGRLNNFLSMTGMLVDHLSNHTRLLYTKGQELHGWYQNLRSWGEKHSEWMERLGLQIESSWSTLEEEHVRRRRMLVRRARSLIILAFVCVVLHLMRKRRQPTRNEKLEAIYRFSHPHPPPY